MSIYPPLIELYQKTIDALPMGIMLVDSDLRIRLINTCYASQLGSDSLSLVGKYLPDLNPGTFARRVMERNQPELGDMCTLPLAGENLKFIVNRIPISDFNDNVVGMVSHIMFTDPVHLRDLNKKIDDLLKRVDFYKKSIHSILHSQYNIDCIIGNSDPIQNVKQNILRYAAAAFPVLVRGATGTGKELVAHALHAESQRKEGPFISLNCAAIPKDLLEAELFGYAPGAFSGAHRNGKPGQIEMAAHGTLFLDEIGDMPLHAQVKLLRVLEEKTVYRVGSVKANHVDFRLVSATNRDLGTMVQQGLFREDLYYRLCALSISLPPLCHRAEDIIPISYHMLSQMGYGHIDITKDAAQAMEAYAWPGNVRQLYNVLAHAVLHCRGKVINLENLPAEFRQGPNELQAGNDDCSLAEYMTRHEEAFLRHAWKQHGGNVVNMAKALGVSRVTLYNKFKKYNMMNA